MTCAVSITSLICILFKAVQFKPFHFQEWPKWNFSLQFPKLFQAEECLEERNSYLVSTYSLVLHQIISAKMIWNVKHSVEI